MAVLFSWMENNLDRVFVWILLISTLSFLYINIKEILSGKEVEFILAVRRMKKSFEGLSYLLHSSSAIKDRGFLNHIVNNGDDPEMLNSKIQIDNQYMTTTSVFMKKR